MKIVGIGHAAYNVTNMEKSLEYYCGILGFQDAFELADQDGNPWIHYIRVAPGQFLELFYNHNEPAAGTNYNHLCINVESAQEVADYLRPLGLLTVDVKQGRSGTLQCWSADPDGNRVEFMEITPNSQQALADERLGK
jgi:lactoylglutathione lyase